MDQAGALVPFAGAPTPEELIRQRGMQPGDCITAAWNVYGEKLGPSATAPCTNIARILREDWGCLTVEGMGTLLVSEFREILSD
jgi:hypothetical protein